MRRGLFLSLLVVLPLVATPALADRIHFKHGDYVDVDAWREEGGKIIYNRFGGEIAVPREDIARIERTDATPTKGAAPGPQSRCAGLLPKVGESEAKISEWARCENLGTPRIHQEGVSKQYVFGNPARGVTIYTQNGQVTGASDAR